MPGVKQIISIDVIAFLSSVNCIYKHRGYNNIKQLQKIQPKVREQHDPDHSQCVRIVVYQTPIISTTIHSLTKSRVNASKTNTPTPKVPVQENTPELHTTQTSTNTK